MKFFKKRSEKKKAASQQLSAADASAVGGFGGGRDGGAAYGQVDGFGRRGSAPAQTYTQHGRGASLSRRQHMPLPTRWSPELLAKLPDAVLDRIFTLVCPHAADETYETCEQSTIDDACMLCDLRDLAHCVAVCKKWKKVARGRMYFSIRIDSVHYCNREIYLSDKRKRRSFFDRNGQPEDTAQARLKLLCRTLRDDPTRLGKLVYYFKTPYMLRESCQADLARTIAVLPHLRYVDLPEGLYMDEPVYMTLRLEVQARCHELRKMTYIGGAERSLERVNVWPSLEVLDLVRINVDPTMLRHVLGGLRNLRALKISDTQSFSDDVLCPNDMLPDFPPLVELILKDVPRVSAEGIMAYLHSPAARHTLKTLSLTSTGVQPWHLHAILSQASSLSHLTIVGQVASSLPMAAGTHDIPPLRSTSLRTLNYEITGAKSVGPFAGSVTSSYYNYLSGSLLSGGLPDLRAVYVRDAGFPDSLLDLPPPKPSFADGYSMRRPSTAEPTSPTTTSTGLSSRGASPTSPRDFLTPGGGGGLSSSFGNMHLGGGSTNPFQNMSPPHNNRRPTGQQQLQPPQMPWAAGGGVQNPRFSSNNPFAAMLPAQRLQRLEVFTKGDDELDWSFVQVAPQEPSPFGNGGDPARPHSSYGLSSEGATAWAPSAGARKSVFMGNGAGGFHLAVPSDGYKPAPGRRGSNTAGGGGGDEWPRPTSSAGEKMRDRLDLWR